MECIHSSQLRHSLSEHAEIQGINQWWATFLPLRAAKTSQAVLVFLAKVHIMFIHIISFPLEAWRATQELLAGHRLPTPGIN